MQKQNSYHNSRSSEPTNEEVAVLAYSFFESEGRPEGRELEHWLCAKEQLSKAAKSPAQPKAAMSSKPSLRAKR
ncbi:MAG: DUF2934 domain-containing protein [Luteolibacter sp.]